MLNPTQNIRLLTALSLLCLAAAMPAFAGESSDSSAMMQTTGDYTINLKVLPAEKFVSKSKAKKSANTGEMVNGGGADPIKKSDDQNPNHHLVAFIKKNGKPVEDADVTMKYRKAGESGDEMKNVPVTTMWVAGKGKKTTHYGNNVDLKPGQYKVRITVNDSAPANFTANVK